MQEQSVEYSYLEDTFQNGGRQVTVVYGMNQIGKTTLFKKFALIHGGVFFLSSPGSDMEIRSSLDKYLKLNKSEESENDLTYEQIFQKMFPDKMERYVFVIDDFQNILKNSEEFFKELFAYVSKNLEHCMIYLVSSHVGWVENQMIQKMGADAALITGFFKLQPMSFEECLDYFNGYSSFDVLLMYSIYSGRIGYLSQLDPKKNYKENILAQMLKENSFLHANMHLNIREQLRETSVYYTILETLSRGKCKLNDIHRCTGYSRAKISVYLKTLMELQFVEKVFSVDTPGRENSQKGVYRICDPVIRFYFTFIYPNESFFVLLEQNDFYEAYVEKYLDSYGWSMFPTVCRNMFEAMNSEQVLPCRLNSVGEWLGKNGHIPILGKNSDDRYLAGFCGNVKEPYDYHLFLEQQKIMEEAMIDPEYIYLFSMFGFDTNLEKFAESNPKIILIDLE